MSDPDEEEGADTSRKRAYSVRSNWWMVVLPGSI